MTAGKSDLEAVLKRAVRSRGGTAERGGKLEQEALGRPDVPRKPKASNGKAVPTQTSQDFREGFTNLQSQRGGSGKEIANRTNILRKE